MAKNRHYVAFKSKASMTSRNLSAILGQRQRLKEMSISSIDMTTEKELSFVEQTLDTIV